MPTMKSAPRAPGLEVLALPHQLQVLQRSYRGGCGSRTRIARFGTGSWAGNGTNTDSERFGSSGWIRTSNPPVNSGVSVELRRVAGSCCLLLLIA